MLFMLFMAPVPPGGRALLALATAALAWLAGPAVHASTFQWFTDQAAFTAALEPGFFTATGEVLRSGGGDLERETESFSGGVGPYGFTVGAPGGLYGTPSLEQPGIQPLAVGTPLTFTAFTSPVPLRAFGGVWSLRTEVDSRSPGSVTVQVFAGVAGDQLLATQSTSITDSSATFLGFIVSDEAPLVTRITFGTSSTELFPTAEELTVGVPVAPVPEPSTLAAAGVGALVLGIAYRRRRRRARGGAVAEPAS